MISTDSTHWGAFGDPLLVETVLPSDMPGSTPFGQRSSVVGRSRRILSIRGATAA